ncbi:unnamed protein product [Menidia menidia]|uniref:Small RNA 2'-O-methyltransferase n=1 Tax=Menidia menidia TaxID=238744 RepID=A0A8S4ADC7_9TELE|nr:unnamed protein product [Menidia menidia]
MNPIFSPPLYRQRHQFVIDFVKKNKPRKVIDLGCGECSLMKKLRFHREIQHLVGVDIDVHKIKKNMHDLAPISTDYLHPSLDQLRVEMYQGSVTQRDARLRGFDLVTSIELIEHLTPADVERFSAVVFGYMTPASVIVSTPNSEYNPLLPGLSGFRHCDHKFEWSRAEFRSWALKVCLEYGYEVEFTGVGRAPEGQQDSFGFCSQIGVFRRPEGRDRCPRAEEVFSYTLLYCMNYPSLQDNNTLRRVVVSEVLYQAEQIKNRWMEERMGKEKEAFGFSQTEGEMEDERTEEMTCPSQPGGRALSDHEGLEESEVCWVTSPDQREPPALNRCVSVPLAVLWALCSKIRELSGSLCNLRLLLLDEPDVKLSQDGSALLVKYQEDQEEELESNCEDDSYAESSQYSNGAEQEEDWETDV